MSKSSRLEPIVSLAERGAREAARSLAQASAELKRREDEVARLQAYRGEYRERARDPGRSMIAGRWQNDRLFVSRLEEVICAQEAVLASARERHRAQLEAWRRSHRHSQALQRLFEDYCREEIAALERREQDESDDGLLRSLLRD